MKRTTRIILVVLIPILLVGAFFLRKSLTSSEVGPQPSLQTASVAQERDNRLGVRAVIAEAVPFSNKLFTTGSIIANEEVRLRPETSGRITKLTLDEGGSIRKGDILVKLNDSELRAQLLRANLQQELAEIREGRQRSLLANSAIAQEDYDVALNQLQTIKAEIELIEAQIEKTEIRAPFDGQIGLKNVSTGSYITPSDIVATLQDLRTIKIDFSIPERYAAFVSAGDRITFTRQGSDSVYTGTVMAIEPRIDATTRTLQLRATAPNPRRDIIPGAFVEIQFELRAIPDAILLPSEAVIPELGGHSVFVSEGGIAKRRPIITGIRTENRVQVVEGINPGDTVLTTGILQLRENVPVRITEFQ